MYITKDDCMKGDVHVMKDEWMKGCVHVTKDDWMKLDERMCTCNDR